MLMNDLDYYHYFFAVRKFLAKIQFFFILPMKKHLIIKVFILFAKTARNTASVRPSRLLRKLISHFFTLSSLFLEK